VKKALEAAVESGEIEARQPAEAYVEFVRVNRERFGI
jgi:hypothetical protein